VPLVNSGALELIYGTFNAIVDGAAMYFRKNMAEPKLNSAEAIFPL
jgi:hypothetical protein